MFSKVFPRTTFLMLIIMVCSFAAKASHVMGGTVTYKSIGSNKYAIEFILYRDCKSVVTLRPYLLYFIKGASSTSTTKTGKYAPLFDSLYVSNTTASCGASTYCVQRGRYRDTITIGTDTVGYHVYYDTVAINVAVTNIYNPGSTGSTGEKWYTFIPPRGTTNSSPSLVKDVTPNLCVKKKNVFDAGFYDPDGDSLVFSIVAPYDSSMYGPPPPSFNTVPYNSGYSYNFPFGTTSPEVLIDSTTGVITASPQKTGLYVVAVQVIDYKVDKLTHKARKMSVVRVNLEFVVGSCGSNPPPVFATDATYKRTLDVGQNFCMKIKAIDTVKYSGKYDTLTLTATSVIFGKTGSFTKPYASFSPNISYIKDSSTFCWTPSCDQITYSQPYTVIFQVVDQGCNVVQQTWSIYVKPRPFVSPPKMRCINILGTQYVQLQWDTIAKDTNFTQYNIYRKKLGNNPGTFNLVKSITNYKVGTWIDSAALNASDTSYQYYITSANTCKVEGFSSDSFQSVIVTAKPMLTGGVEFDWNSISKSYKDSFAVYADTGTGLKLVTVTNSRQYLYPYCHKNIKLQVAGRSKATACQSYSNYSRNAKDSIAPVKKPIINSTVVSWSEVDMVFTKTTSTDIDHYTIYRSENGGPLKAIDSIYSFGLASATTILYKDKTATPGSKSYCYTVAAVDHCNNRQVYDKHCVMYAVITPKQLGLKVKWTPYFGYTPDTVKVQQYTGSKWITRKLVKATDSIFSDTSITCLPRTYRIIGLNNTGSLITLSDSVTGTPIDTVPPTSPPLGFVSYDPSSGTQIDINFSTIGDKDLLGYKMYSWADGVLGAIPTTYNHTTNPGNLTATPTASSVKKYCYDYVAFDSCGNISKIQKHCAIELFGTAANMAGILTWTPYKETGLLNYYIEKKNTSGSWVKVDTTLHNTDTTITENLLCKSTNSYRIKAVVAGGIVSYSNIVTISPIDTALPAAPVINYVTVSAQGAITVNWQSSTSKIVKDYEVDYKTQHGAWKVATILTLKNTFTVTGLNTADSIYDFRIIAIDSCAGNRSKSSTVHQSILLKTTAQNLSNQLSWSAYLGFVPKQYDIYGLISSVWTKIGTVSGSTLTYTDTGLHCNVTYYYKILATDLASSANTSYSDSTAATPFDTTAPIAPVINYVTDLNSSTIAVNWTKSTSKKVKLYEVQYKSLNGPWTVYTKLTFHTADTIRNIDTRDSIYDFRIIAVDSCAANRSLPSVVHQSILLSGTSGNLANQLSWTAYKGFTVKEYDIYSLLNNVWTKVGTVNGSTTTYLHTGLKCNVPYYYKVAAISTVSSAYFSYSDSISVTPFDTVKPQQVNIRSVTVLSSTSTQIIFDKVADPVVTKYQIFFSKNGGAFSLLTTITKPNSNPVLYTHTSLNTQSDSFAYQVFAVDSCAGNTSATTQQHSPVLLSGTAGDYAATLNWTFYKGFAVKNYIVEYFSGSWKTLATLASNVKTFTDAPVPCIAKYYRIRVVPTSGNATSVSDSIKITPFDTVKPSAPVIQYATVTSNSSIFIKWTKSSSNDVRRYDIYRKASGSSSYSFLKTVADVDNYTDNVNTDKNISYCYEIKAVDSCANNSSPFSPEHCVVNVQADSNTCYQKIFINWNAYVGWPTGVKNYLLYRRVQGSSTDVLLATLSSSTLSYTDSSISNTIGYCYQIVAIQNSGANTSASNRSCSKIYQIAVPQIYSASKTSTSATNGNVVVKWKSLAGQRFYKYYQLYYKAQTGSTYTLLQDNILISNDSFIHSGINTKTLDHDYYLVVVDSCGNKTVPSKSHQTMTVTITVGQLIHNISWTPYSGFGIKYYLIQRLEHGVFTNVDTVPPTKTKDFIFPAPCNYNIFYRISAVDSFGHHAWSDTMGKQALDTIPSNAPTFNNATVINNHSVLVSFYGADSADTYSYYIQRQTNGNWATAGKMLYTSPHAYMQYTDNVSTLKDEHCYTIITLDSCLNATASDTFCTITLTGKPLNEANKLNWTKFKGYGIKNYKVLRLVGNSWVPLSNLTNKDTSLIHDSLHCYLPQYYKVEGIEAGGARVTYSDSIQLIPFDTIIPPASVLQYATANQSGGGVKLLWSYNKYSDVKYFEIWRKVNSGPFTYLHTTVLDSTYLDPGANIHTDTVSYYVITVDSCNATHRSPKSDSARVMNVKLKTTACVPWINLVWSAYRNMPGGVDFFNIYRADGNGPFKVLTTVNSNVLKYDDYAVSVGTKYTYKIQAHGPLTKLSSFSDTFSLVPYVYPTADTAKLLFSSITKTGLTNGATYLHWLREPATDTLAKGYRIYELDPVTHTYHAVFQTSDLTDTALTLTGINTVTKTHRYKLAVYNLCNTDDEPGFTHQPVNLQVYATNDLKAKLVWTAYSGAKVLGYDIYRARDNGASMLIGTHKSGDTSFLDTGLVCRHRYIYGIKVRLAGNRISLSDTFGITGTDTILPPKAKLFVISTDSTLTTGGKIGMRWSWNDKISRKGYNIYRQVNNGPFQFYYQVVTAKTDTIYWQDQFANTVANTYAYYIRAIDSCGNEAMPVDTHRVVNLKVKAYSEYIALKWTAYHGFQNWKYTIEKRTLKSSWQPVTVFSSNILSYIDSNVNCHIFYQYRIRYTDLNSKLFGFSNIAGDTAFDTVPPKISQIIRATVIKTGTNTGVNQIDWEASVTKNNFGYLVYRSLDNSHWTKVSGLVVGLTWNDSNLNTYGRPYYYKITPVDTCGNLGKGFSAIHETMRLKVQAGDQQVKLHWNPYQGWNITGYKVYRDKKLLALVSKDSVNYIDTIATCKFMYHYTVEAESVNNGVNSMSNEDSAKPWDNIGPARVYIRSASIDVGAGQAVISWDSSRSFDVKNYYIYRKLARTGEMILVDSTDKTIYYEDISHIKGPDCYYVFAHDFCGNQSAGSNRACLIILQGENQKAHNLLSWNSYFDWPDGVKGYNIYREEDKNGWQKINTNSAGNLNYDDKQLTDDIVDYCYQVEAIENDGKYNATSKSTMVCLHQDPYVYIPNTFTPHTTFGINDVFGPKGMFIKNYHMDIYNRWGEKLYHTDNSGTWDGTFQGTLAPANVYMYVIKVESYNGNSIFYKGNVMILY